jgi:hypothetical protein
MRDDLDSIKIDENGFLDRLKLENLSIWGTKPLIAILNAAAYSIDNGNSKGDIIYLIDTALEKAKDFDACIGRLVKEQIEKK